MASLPAPQGRTTFEGIHPPPRRPAPDSTFRTPATADPVDVIERALRDNPNDLATLLRAAQLCLELERPADTSALLTRAMMLAPHRPEPFVFMSTFLRMQGMHADAIELLQRAIQKNPGAAELWQAAAKVMTDLQEDGDALAFYDEALRLRRECLPCRQERAALYTAMGRLDEALDDYEKLRAAAPRDAGVLVGWGDTHALLGRADSARAAYAAALGLVRERAIVEDRLRRLAITEIVLPLERRPLPAWTPAPSAGEPRALNIVFFHVETDAASVPFDKPDYQSMLAAAVLAARKKAPQARVVLLTDERTPPPSNVRFDRIVRQKLDSAQLMYERMRAQRSYLASLDDGSNTIFIDSDVVVNRDPSGIFDGSFDIGLSWRTSQLEAPFNGGAIYASGTAAALAFFDAMLAAYPTLEGSAAIRAHFPDGIRCWWGDQLAMAATVGWQEFARRDSDRLWVAGTVVRFLAQRDYNFVMERTTPLAVPDRLNTYLVHFKGTRKRNIWAYLEHILKVEEPAAPAIASAAPEQADDHRYSTYDLGFAPITYDVTYFLALAKNRGIRHIDIVPGPHSGFRDDAWCQKADASEKQFRLWNIVLPACQLAGMTVTMHRDRARAAATPYKMRAVIGEGIAGDVFRATDHARRWVARWLESRGLSRPVVVNLRESQWSARNSNMSAWRRFAAETNAVVIPDTDGETAFGHVFDGLSMDRRLALYEAASVVMGANNGPMALCWLSRSIPYLTFRMVADHPACTPEFFARQGLPVGAQWPWAGPHQRIVWADDDYATIARAYGEFSAASPRR